MTIDRHRLGQRIVEQGLDQRRRAVVIRVDEHEVRRVGARELERGLRIIGALALEGAGADHRLFGEGVRERFAANDEDGDGRQPGSVVDLLRHGHVGGGLAWRGLSPGECRKVVEDLSEERDLFRAEPAGVGPSIEDRQHVLEGPRHRLEPQETSARIRARAGGVAARRGRTWTTGRPRAR